MMKAYKVITGYETDFYGYTIEVEIAKYFFDKKEAEKFYKEGERTHEITAIYTTCKNGTVIRATTGAAFYEKEVKNARENEKVVKETIVENIYRMEEIEIN